MLITTKKLIARATITAFIGASLTPTFAMAQGTVTCTVVDTKSISANDLFDFDKSALSANGKQVLNGYADNLKNMKSITSISLVGHTDGKGTEAYNYALGQRRADAVKAYLTSKGVDPAMIQATSRGKMDLLNNELTANGKDDPVKRQANRRVEITTAGQTVVAGASCPTPAVAQSPAGAVVATTEASGGLTNAAIIGGVVAVGAAIAVAASSGGGGSSGTTGTTGTR